MTTFTRIDDADTPAISVDVTRRLSKIDDNIYGGFMEHMGRCIYGGIYDPLNPLSDEHGYRKDVLSELRSLNLPVIRYPGGNFVATYHWTDGIGPISERPSRPELAWLGTETNEFGTDEFMHWLSVLNEAGPGSDGLDGKVKQGECQPYFCLNFGTGTLDEALAWVEYCNGTRNTHWANLRRKNGREEPYRIKYWALGNEMWGDWQVGQMTKEDYAKTAKQWAKALKLLDPSLILILCGETGHASWDHYVLKECIKFVDMHSIHIYTSGTTHMTNVTAPLSAERAIQTAASLIDMARIENGMRPDVPRQTICFDEWNVWDPIRAPGELGAEEAYTLSDALAVSVWLNVFIRQSEYLGMCNIAQSVNVISPLMTTETGVLKQTTWWPLYLFCKYMRGWTIGVHVRGQAWDGETTPAWLQGVLENGASFLDVSAVISQDGWIGLAVVNLDEQRDFVADLKGVGGNVKVYRVTGKDVHVKNTADKEEVGLKESEWDGEGRFKFEKHSLTLLRWDSGERVKEVVKNKKTGIAKVGFSATVGGS